VLGGQPVGHVDGGFQVRHHHEGAVGLQRLGGDPLAGQPVELGSQRSLDARDELGRVGDQ
jgi:hypothetical protein